MRNLRCAILGLLLTLATLLVGCRPDVSQFLGGDSNARLIASPQIVKAWRTKASLKNEEELKSDEFGGFWQKSGEATVVPADVAAKLSRILSNKRSYEYHPARAKSSPWLPCVVLNFSDGRTNVDVFLAFLDNSLTLLNPADPDPKKCLAHADIDPSRTEVVRVVKEIFPRDEQIQSLNESKSDGYLFPRNEH